MMFLIYVVEIRNSKWFQCVVPNLNWYSNELVSNHSYNLKYSIYMYFKKVVDQECSRCMEDIPSSWDVYQEPQLVFMWYLHDKWCHKTWHLRNCSGHTCPSFKALQAETGAFPRPCGSAYYHFYFGIFCIVGILIPLSFGIYLICLRGWLY